MDENEFDVAAKAAFAEWQNDRFEAEDVAYWTPEEAYHAALADLKARLV